MIKKEESKRIPQQKLMIMLRNLVSKAGYIPACEYGFSGFYGNGVGILAPYHSFIKNIFITRPFVGVIKTNNKKLVVEVFGRNNLSAMKDLAERVSIKNQKEVKVLLLEEEQRYEPTED